jgi:NAD+ kinase
MYTMFFSVINRNDPLSEQKKEEVIDYLTKKGFSHCHDAPDIIIAIGGDGTVLQAFHTYEKRLAKSAFVAYNTGHLGFYSDWDDLTSLLEAITQHKLKIVEYPLLKVQIEEKGQTTEYLALNDMTIKGLKSSIQVDVHLNEHLFESFRGDGLCISTPSGSTGYNKSLGGAIVHPSIDAIQLAEMASINNRVYRTIGSALIIPDHHTLTLKPTSDSYVLSVDHESFYSDIIQKITCTSASVKIKFLRHGSFPFWNRVKEAFIAHTTNEKL